MDNDDENNSGVSPSFTSAFSVPKHMKLLDSSFVTLLLVVSSVK